MVSMGTVSRAIASISIYRSVESTPRGRVWRRRGRQAFHLAGITNTAVAPFFRVFPRKALRLPKGASVDMRRLESIRRPCRDFVQRLGGRCEGFVAAKTATTGTERDLVKVATFNINNINKRVDNLLA